MNAHFDRRQLLASMAALPFAAQALSRGSSSSSNTRAHPVAIASGNGVRTVELAVARMLANVDPLDAIVEGVAIVEADPTDQSVGIGGLPNADGVVQLDASCMHGPSNRAGAVACIEGVLHPAQVALAVLKTTDHVLLVGAGATRFARELGFPEVDLLTPQSRADWLAWRANLNPNDDYLDADQQLGTSGQKDVPYTTGTLHCSAVDASGNLAGCTTTSGLSWKIPGRVGDSPIVGAGMYTDGEVGSAGATGRGEAVIESCGAHAIVREMESGKTPTEACLAVLARIARRQKRPHLLGPDGRPNFDVVVYALRKDGVYGSASMYGDRQFAVCDAKGARLETCAGLFTR